MSMGKILLILIVIGAVGGGVYYFNSGGSVPLSTTSATDTIDAFTSANAEFSKSNYLQAIQEYEAAIEAEPDHPKVAEAYYRIAYCHDQLKNNQEALEAYETYVEKFPDDSRVGAARKRIGYYANTN